MVINNHDCLYEEEEKTAIIQTWPEKKRRYTTGRQMAYRRKKFFLFPVRLFRDSIKLTGNHQLAGLFCTVCGRCC